MSTIMADAFDADFARRCALKKADVSSKKPKVNPPVFVPLAVAECCLNEEKFLLTDITFSSDASSPWIRGKKNGRMTWVPKSCVKMYMSKEDKWPQ